MKQIYFICNLHSGRASAGAHLAMIIDKFTAAGFQVTVHPTQDRGDATACAKLACDAGCYDILVCSGGDGHPERSHSGLYEKQDPVSHRLLPLGSTNDFARGLGIPKDPEQAVDCIIHGEDLVCDVGSFNDKYFTYVAAFGAFTEISYETPQHFKNLLGHSAYLLNAISKLPKIRAYRMRIEYDGGVIEDEFLYGMVTNSSSVAKFLALSDVRWDDGLFEVTLIHKPSNLVEFHKLVMAFSKIQLGLAKQYLHYFRTSHLKVTALDEEPVSWTIDGEYGGTERVNEVFNRKQAVTFHVDPACREQAEENADSGFAIVKPLPDDVQPFGIEKQTDDDAENSFQPEEPDPRFFRIIKNDAIRVQSRQINFVRWCRKSQRCAGSLKELGIRPSRYLIFLHRAITSAES